MTINFDGNEIYNIETGETIVDIELLEPKDIELIESKEGERHG